MQFNVGNSSKRILAVLFHELFYRVKYMKHQNLSRVGEDYHYVIKKFPDPFEYFITICFGTKRRRFATVLFSFSVMIEVIFFF